MIKMQLDTLGYAIAGIGAAGFAASLVISDMVGDANLAFALKTVIRQVQRSEPQRPVTQKEDLSRFKRVTLFDKAPVQGSNLEVHTGIEYASVPDLLAGKETTRWCYVIVGGRSGFPRQVELGRQVGTSAPVYNDLKRGADDALANDLSVNALSSIARSHCRFADRMA